MKQDKTIHWFKSHKKAKKVIVYQNLKFFLVPSLIYEKINPQHKILVRGLKKRKYRDGNANYEKIALLLKNSLPLYLLMLYIVVGWLLLCK